FPVKQRTFAAFDYLMIAFLNIGYFYRKAAGTRAGYIDPEFFTLPRAFIEEHHYVFDSGWEKVLTKGLDLKKYRNEEGFELIARALKVPYPHHGPANTSQQPTTCRSLVRGFRPSCFVGFACQSGRHV